MQVDDIHPFRPPRGNTADSLTGLLAAGSRPASQEDMTRELDSQMMSSGADGGDKARRAASHRVQVKGGGAPEGKGGCRVAGGGGGGGGGGVRGGEGGGRGGEGF